MSTQTPMMQQYREVKARYPGMILLFRMGDFYEMFYDDAQVAARVLGLTLTSRSKGDKAIPMAGVPHHSVHTYVKRLIEAGHKVAVCDQIEDPREAKGLVERDVTRVITPGTLTEDSAARDARSQLPRRRLLIDGERAGLAWVDLEHRPVLRGGLSRGQAGGRIDAHQPGGTAPAGEPAHGRGRWSTRLRRETGAMVTPRPDWAFGRDTRGRSCCWSTFGVRLARRLRLRRTSGPSLSAAGATLQYLQETQKISLGHIRRLSRVRDGRPRGRSTARRRLSLELTRTMRDGEREGTLLGVLDRTQDAHGRAAAEGVAHQPAALRRGDPARQDGVEELVKDRRAAPGDCARCLHEVYDIERLTARVATGRANARDLLALRRSLEPLPALKERLPERFAAAPAGDRRADSTRSRRSRELIAAAIASDPPVPLKRRRD